MLVELGLVEHNYQSVLAVLNDGATVVGVARRHGWRARRCTTGRAATRARVCEGLIARCGPLLCPH